MMASPPIDTAVDCPRPAAESVLQISVVMPPERDMTPIGPFLKARRTFTAGPPRPPILASSGDRMPRQFGPMMRAPRCLEHRHRAVAVLDAILAEDLEAVVLPGAGDAEDRDRVGRVASRLDAALDDAAGHDVDPRVRHDVHHHRDLLDARLGQDEL